MTTFQIIILFVFSALLVGQFMAAIEHDCLGPAVVFAFELMAFAYLATVLM